MKKIILIVLTISFVLVSSSWADITFTNGLWTQDFSQANCTPDYNSFASPNANCISNGSPLNCCTGLGTGSCTHSGWSCKGIDIPAGTAGFAFNCDYAHATRVTTGTPTGGTGLTLIDTTKNFVTAGVTLGDSVEFWDGRNRYIARILSISTTTNTNDTLNLATSEWTYTAPTTSYYVFHCNTPPDVWPMEITTAASRTGDSGDQGYRTRRGPGLDCGNHPGWNTIGQCDPGNNAYASGNQTHNLTIKLGTSYPNEFWIRTYFRYDVKFQWDEGPVDIKFFYLFLKRLDNWQCVSGSPTPAPCSCCTGLHTGTCPSAGASGDIVNLFADKWYLGFFGKRGQPHWFFGKGMKDIYGGSSVSDGSWHYYEFRFKLNSPNTADGEFDFWVDTRNIRHATGLKYYDDGTCGVEGWDNFTMPHNGGYWSGIVGGVQHAGYQDFDDIAIADSTYGGFIQDINGYKRIGPVGGGTASSPVMSAGSPVNNATYPSGTGSVNMTLTTNVPANCKYNATDVGYGSMIADFAVGQGTTSHTQGITSADGSVHDYYIRCDTVAGGMPDTSSLHFSWNVLNTTPPVH